MPLDPTLLHPIIAALFGACMGSFISMASYRLPHGMDIVFKPSHCTSCQSTLGFFDLFPIFSWLFARGKCRHCSAKISVRYPLIELASAIVFLGLFLRYGASLECLVLMLMATCILILIVTDFEYTIIPDSIQIALLILVAALLWLRELPLDNALYGAAAGAATGLSLRFGYLYFRKIEALGWADVKLLPIIGLAVGLKPLILVLILSGLFGVITAVLWRIAGRGPEFPFGPALAMSMFGVIVFSVELSQIFWLREFFAL